MRQIIDCAKVAYIAIIVVCAILYASFAAAAPTHAQSSDGNQPKFDVASIKRNNSDETQMVYQLRRSGLFVAQNVTVQFLIKLGYGVQPVQVIGGPQWIRLERFDVQAEAAGISNPDQMLPMIQALLAARFALRMHSDTKQLPVLRLEAIKGGLKLNGAQPGACLLREANGAKPQRNPSQQGMLACGRIYYPAPNEILGKSVGIPQFAEGLTSRVGVTVIDKTSDRGKYDIDFRWTPDEPNPVPETPDTADTPQQSLNLALPAIQDALHDQLGLKLASGKGPVEVFVVDHVEEPTPN